MSKYKVARIITFPLNFLVLFVLYKAFGIEFVVVVGLALIIATIDEFGYKWEEKQTTKPTAGSEGVE